MARHTQLAFAQHNIAYSWHESTQHHTQLAIVNDGTWLGCVTIKRKNKRTSPLLVHLSFYSHAPFQNEFPLFVLLARFEGCLLRQAGGGETVEVSDAVHSSSRCGVYSVGLARIVEVRRVWADGGTLVS